jgi:hypothetical protein
MRLISCYGICLFSTTRISTLRCPRTLVSSGRAIAMAIFMLSLTGCEAGEGAFEAFSSTLTTFQSVVETQELGNVETGGGDTYPQICLANDLAGSDVWKTQCSNCHGANNEGGAFPAVLGVDRDSLTAIVASTMPLGNAENCMGDCADQVVDFILAFRAENCSSTSTGSKPNLFTTQAYEQTLYSATFNLASRFPTESEVNEVASQGLGGLGNVLDQLMSEDAFAERIMEIYGDLVQVEQFSPNHNHGGAILGISFDEAGVGNWYNDYGVRDYEDHVAIQRAHVREPLQLVKHVVKEGLDFREILTAKYTMVNNLNAFTYAPYAIDQFPYKDIGEYRPMVTTTRPQVGILGTVAFMHKFQTTDANRNRKRAYAVFDLFLDTDIRTLGGTVVAAADLEAATNVLTDPDCRSCHTIMDPVASAFQHYDNKGYYKPNRQWHEEMAKPGLAGAEQPDNSTVEPLRWVAEKIADDPRFASATVRTVFEGLFGQDVLRISSESLPEQLAQYEIQQAYLVPWAALFIESGYDIRALVKAMILSDYYQAESIVESEFSAVSAGLNNTQKTFVEERVGGSTSILTPEMLSRKTKLLTGEQSWGNTGSLYDGYLDPINVDNGLGVLYGGIDFKDNTQRLRDLNGFMLAIQERMSYDIACEAVTLDFSKAEGDRLFFNNINIEMEPAVQATAIRNILSKMIWTLWGLQATADSEQVTIAYNLLLAIYAENIDADSQSYNCHNTRGNGRHLKMAMAGVLTYLLSDYRFNNL